MEVRAMPPPGCSKVVVVVLVVLLPWTTSRERSPTPLSTSPQPEAARATQARRAKKVRRGVMSPAAETAYGIIVGIGRK
jgi:hypothetical protein